MRILTILTVLVIVLAGAAFLTRPGPEDFDRMLATAIRDRVARTDIGSGGDALGTVALVGCKLRPTDCIKLVREALDVQFDEGLFSTRATVRGLGKEATCTGVFRHFWCSRDITSG